jgi:hypothetical protein
MFTSVLNGIHDTMRHYRMTLAVWAARAGVAAVIAAPALAWWRGALNHAVEAQGLLGGFNLATWTDVSKYDAAGVFGLLVSGLAAGMFVSAIGGCFVMGGVLEVFATAGTDRGTMRRFFTGGAGYFWRFFRLLLVGGTATLLAGACTVALLGAVQSGIVEEPREASFYVLLALDLLVLTVVCGFFLLALDYARIHIVANDASRALDAYVRGLEFVIRHAMPAYGMAMMSIMPVVGLAVGYLAYETLSPVASSWSTIALLFVIQQLIVLLLIGLRMALVGAEFSYFSRMPTDRSRLVAVPPI